jgi:uncharacterized protein (DUF1778 family)
MPETTDKHRRESAATHRAGVRKGERLDLRLPAELKEIIERAAAALGQTVSSFILGVAVPHARGVLRDAETLTLTGQDRDRFLAALDADDEPSEALRRAAGRYKAAIGDPS